ncbi:MAG: hypothetical protein IJ275_02165 [Ruminococcus sp.]|nr:hypothetical protein [Ruminococcus sp.]
MDVLFLLQVISLAVMTVTAIMKRDFKPKEPLKLIATVLAVVLGLGVFFTGSAFANVGLGVSICAVVSLLLSIFSRGKSKSEGLKNTALFASKALLVILLLESLVFNFNSFHVWGSNFEEFDLSLSDASVQNLSLAQNDTYRLENSDNEAVIEFTDINREIGTIYFDINSTSACINYDIDFADESNSSYYIRQGLVKGEIFPEIEDSKYVICNFSGDVSKLKIKLSSDSSFTLSDTIGFNYSHPSTFSVLRVLTFLLFAVFVFLFVKSVFLNRSVKEQENSLKSVTALVVLVLLCIMMFMTSNAVGGNDIFHMTDGNQMTKELVDAFEQGKVTLDTVPAPELLALDNPYDWSQRVENDVYALWDHVMYDGEYYSYYGIGPVVLLFLPYHLITGYYFPSMIATFIFSSVGLVFLALTFMKLCKRYFSDIPMSMYIVSLIMVLCTCGIWYCLLPSNFYEIAQTSGFCFVTMGAYYLVSANVFSKGKISVVKLMLSSLFLSIAVTCRPTTAIWCVVSLLFIGTGIIKIKRNKKQGENTVSYVKYLSFALLPFVVIGSLQMIYNYIRFDSFTDFGIQYSLTINDFLSAQYHTQFAAIGFYNYLLAPPSFSSEFPFVATNISQLDVNGYYFTATNNGVGLFFRALPMLALFLSPCVLKYIKKENKGIVATLFLAVAVIAPCIIIFSVWESGYGVRYMVDFAWQMLTCALFVVFMLYRHTKSEETRRIYRYFMLVSMLCCIVINFGLTYSYISVNSISNETKVMLEEVARAFSIFRT